MPNKSPEISRFTGYLGVYLENSRGVSRQAAMNASPSPAPTNTNTPGAAANKTINSRRVIYGDKATSGAGIQSIKKAGKTRTNSSKQ